MREQLVDGHFLEGAETENLENCVEADLQGEPFSDDGDEDVDRDRDPDLCAYGVLRCAVESLDAQVLLDPLEEELDLPTAAIELGDGGRGEIEIVGEDDQRLALDGIAHFDAPEGCG